MSQFTVREPIQLRPDPDPDSPSVGVLTPGDRITDPLRLGDWAKVEARGEDGRVQVGWMPAGALEEIVGQTVKLHPEPLSEDFVVVTGSLEPLLELANWRKVRVTTATEVRLGWLDVTAPGPSEDDVRPEDEPIPDPGAALDLGVNEVYRAPLLKAQEFTGIDAAALAALIDAEASKIKDGPNKGQWNSKAFNNSSKAAGLTQFLESTWREHARRSGTLLNKVAKEKGLVTVLDAIATGRENDLLALRFDPECSIVSAAEYGVANLRTLEKKGLVSADLDDDEKARLMYLAHHEGATGAIKFLTNQNSSSFDKFAKQVGRERAGALVEDARGDVALAYRNWLNSYMDEKIQPAKFRKTSTGPIINVPGAKALAKFDGAAIPMALLGGREVLVREVQQALIRFGYLDPPADGLWGSVSTWSLGEFCRDNAFSQAEGFTPDIARALLNPTNPLPDIRPMNGWFDKVVAYMNREGYWICRHPSCTNIVYLEGVDPDGNRNDDRKNVFNDLRVVFTIDSSGTPQLHSWEGTTEPGQFWTINPMNPRGAARIAFDQYKAWSVGTHKKGTPSGHEALVQVKPVSVHRDLNKDFKRTDDKIDTGVFGINQHWGYNAPKNDLGRTSAGCLVGRTKSGHREFMALLKADPRFQAVPTYKFISTVLPGDEVLG